MKNIIESSGNIKLRLPKSLHNALIHQAKYENVSLNQLCLMYLSAEVSRSSSNLGTEEFDRRLKIIYLNSKTDKEMFLELNKLNAEVEALKPKLLQEIKNALDEHKRLMNDYVKVLEYIYPIYCGNIIGEKLPVLKIPSAKISLRPKEEYCLDFKEIETLVMGICPNAVVAYGDYDYFLPLNKRLEDKTNIISITINICCEYNILEDTISKIKKEILNNENANKMDILVKPSYLYMSTRTLLKQCDDKECYM